MNEANLPNINLILKHKELIAQLLEAAANQFMNHGCNDFYLTDCLPERSDRHELAKTVFNEDDPDEYRSEDGYNDMKDYVLMLFFADKIRKLTTDA